MQSNDTQSSATEVKSRGCMQAGCGILTLILIIAIIAFIVYVVAGADIQQAA